MRAIKAASGAPVMTTPPVYFIGFIRDFKDDEGGDDIRMVTSSDALLAYWLEYGSEAAQPLTESISLSDIEVALAEVAREGEVLLSFKSSPNMKIRIETPEARGEPEDLVAEYIQQHLSHQHHP
jgi:hypothetical protein